MSTWIATDLLKLKLCNTAVGGWNNMHIYFMLTVQWIIGMILKINSNVHSIWFCCGFYQSVSVQLEYMQAVSLLPELPVIFFQRWKSNTYNGFPPPPPFLSLSLSLSLYIYIYTHTGLSEQQSVYLAVMTSYIANIGSILHVQPLFLATVHLYDDFCVAPGSGRQRTEAWALHRTVVKCRRGLGRQVKLSKGW
jgi:hypothetical protein